MAADAGSFVAGPYTATYGGVALGTTEQGFWIEPTGFQWEAIRIDQYGQAMVDGIWQGYNVGIRFELSEWTASARATIQFPFDTSPNYGTLVDIGKSLVGGGFARSLVLIPVANINSANKTYTFPLTVPNNGGGHGAFSLSSKHRKVTCNMVALVAKATGVIWTESA